MLFACFWLAVFPVAWALFFLCWPVYSEFLAGMGQFYFWVDGKGFQFVVEGSELWFKSFRRPSFEAGLELTPLIANTAAIWALVIATPGIRWRKRLGIFGIATGFLLLAHLMFLITKVEVTLVAAEHPLSGNEAFWSFWDDFFEISGKGFFPVLIWVSLTYRYLLGHVDRRDQEAYATVSRNDPCPCGSGKKFKRCCG